MLWPVHGPPIEKHDPDQVPDYENPPYWNPINEWWEPRQVYEVEITTPKGHPYGTKTVYIDVEISRVPLSVAYTKSGEPWRVIYSMIGPEPAKSGEGGPAAYQLYNFGVWDFSKNHGNYMDCGRCDTNVPLRYEDITPRLLSEAASGKRLGQTPDFGKGP